MASWLWGQKESFWWWLRPLREFSVRCRIGVQEEMPSRFCFAALGLLPQQCPALVFPIGWPRLPAGVAWSGPHAGNACSVSKFLLSQPLLFLSVSVPLLRPCLAVTVLAQVKLTSSALLASPRAASTAGSWWGRGAFQDSHWLLSCCGSASWTEHWCGAVNLMKAAVLALEEDQSAVLPVLPVFCYLLGIAATQGCPGNMRCWDQASSTGQTVAADNS